jgi:hypothetical protein
VRRKPNADQWPQTIGTPRVLRTGTSNHGMNPCGAFSSSPLTRKSMTPSAVQKRMRVIAFTITRSRSMPRRLSRQASGFEP